MNPLELIEKKYNDLAARRAQVLRDLDAIDGALQILEELREEMNRDENQISDRLPGS